MVSDSPETIKSPFDVLNTSDWAQKAGLEFTRITVAWSGRTRAWTLCFTDGVSIRATSDELESPSKLARILRDKLLKPVLLPKSKDMWVAYWLTYIMEAHEEIHKDSGMDVYIQELLSDSHSFMTFDSARKAAAHFAEHKYDNPSVNDNVIFGANVPHKRLIRTPVLLTKYMAVHGARPDPRDVTEVLRRLGYREGSPIPCQYTANEEQHQSSVFFWFKAATK